MGITYSNLILALLIEKPCFLKKIYMLFICKIVFFPILALALK